jgi:hypothetical protein
MQTPTNEEFKQILQPVLDGVVKAAKSADYDFSSIYITLNTSGALTFSAYVKGDLVAAETLEGLPQAVRNHNPKMAKIASLRAELAQLEAA